MLHPSVEKTYREARERLKGLIPEEWNDDRANSLVVKSLVLPNSSPAQAITQVAADKDADLIVVGTHGRKGLTRMLMGSTAESLLRRSPCPVLVVKHKAVARAA
jgi:nucleotide-binding universal stress UspA family protein